VSRNIGAIHEGGRTRNLFAIRRGEFRKIRDGLQGRTQHGKKKEVEIDRGRS